MKKLVLLLCAISVVNSARILGYFYIPSISHQFVFRSLMKELSLRGHNVTFITPNPLRDPHLTNLNEIDISDAYNSFKKYDFSQIGRSYGLHRTNRLINDFNEDVARIEMENEKVQELLKKPSDSFDLILVEPHFPFLFGLRRKFNAPLVAVSSLGVSSYYHYLVGNPTHPVLFPDLLSEKLGPLSNIIDKIDSLYVTIFWAISSEISIFPRAEIVAAKYFGETGPSIKELIRETSLWLLNANPIFSDRRPNVPNVVEFFNIHMERNESYPKDLKQILDNAKEGVVYFSLGTNVRFDHVQGDVKKNIMAALGDLPYTVICKWESESIEGQPKNVHLRKWLPQQAVLAHPNVKVFITQGGLQSSEEAIINAVPLVVIPFLGDQPLNAKILKSNGMAETISPKELNRELLRDTILTVARKENYRQRAKELRDIFLDQPQSGVDKVVWWCEYVIRHKGAKHLRSPAADISLYHYFMIDVIAVFILSFYLTFKIIQLVFAIIVGLFRRKPAEAEVSRKKKKKN
ncbi:UDP-glycosyltransferase UGT5-like isoform X4 [Harmonia axyridis]|uniref:UDP-glycosyltransferase UGT5-like isoform X4 n=1 Tax=Harmonia axyridis TaxID=115357 RepID=UPI001E2775E0|nr:UDP-glycosyltransferase UGT5-like isoform X4 [Harmonia axyridis]